MPTGYVGVDFIGASPQAPGENIYIARDTDLGSVATGIIAIGLQGSNAVTVAGSVFALDGFSIYGLGGTFATTSIVVTATGSVYGRYGAVELTSGNVRVFNDGEIHGGTTGIRITAGLGSTAEVTNGGTVIGADVAVDMPGAGRLLLFNTGLIQALADTGTAVAGGSGSDRVTNAGTFAGAVALGAGNDLYDGADGRLLRGAILGGTGADTLLGGDARDVLAGEADADSLDGGAGDDVLRPGAGVDVIEGGGGARDMLDYLGSRSVVVSLATGETALGDAAGDEFSGIEWVAGGNFNDILTGDAFANALFGRGGNDLLSGESGNDLLSGEIGNDTMVGGAGVDVLRGGIGADLFRFLAATDSGAAGAVRDRVADFSAAQVDRIDVAAIDANGTLAGNQGFVFVGGAAFTAAGQIRAQVINGNTYVSANTDANLASVEFGILLGGAAVLSAADFIL